MQHALSALICQKVQDPRVGLATVTEVDLSPDLKNARVYVSVVGSELEVERSLRGLARAAPYLRGQLARQLALRVVPELSFRLDQSLDQAERITTLLVAAEAGPEAVPPPERAALPAPETHRTGRAGQPPPAAPRPPRRRRRRARPGPR